jgi:hypothetical protein
MNPMNSDHHPVDHLLRDYAGSPEPSPTDRMSAEFKLQHAILDADRLSPRAQRRPVLIWAAGLVAIVVGGIFAILISQPTPAQATIEEIATIVAGIDPLTASDDEYVYTRSTAQALAEDPKDALGEIAYDKDSLIYLANSTRETWYGTGGTVQIRTTLHEPTFFTGTDRDVYYAAGLDQRDQIGQTFTTTETQPIEEWPTDRSHLDQAIRDQMVTDRGLRQTVEYLDVAFDIIGESFASPQLRATTLRLIGRLDGLRLVDKTPDGSVTFAVDYTDRDIQKRLTFTIDLNGYLRYHQILNISADPDTGIPAHTAIYDAEFAEPMLTDSLHSG